MSSDPAAFAPADFRFMARALELARHGWYSSAPNPRVGCVIVRDGELIAEGYHARTGAAHAEAAALAQVDDARGATVYVTLEPCDHHGRTPACSQSLIEAGVARVVYAMTDPNPKVAGRGATRLADAGINTESGLLAEAARRLNRGFLQRMKNGRPRVTLKLATSLDAKIALADGSSKWITGVAARGDVQRLRAQSCAIVTGAGTVVADDPRLTVRDERFERRGRVPVRVVLDSLLRVDPGARVFEDPATSVVYTADGGAERRAEFDRRGIELVTLEKSAEGVSLTTLLADLAARECNEVLVEAGPTLVSSFIDARLFEELIVYLAPKILGAGARDAFPTRTLDDLAAAHQLDMVDVTAVGSDLRLTFTPVA